PRAAVLPGRGQPVADGGARQDVGPARPDADAVRAGEPGHALGALGDQRAGPAGVPAAREAGGVGGGDRLPGPAAAAPRAAAPGGGDGPGPAPRVEGDDGAHRESDTAACGSPAPILA